MTMEIGKEKLKPINIIIGVSIVLILLIISYLNNYDLFGNINNARRSFKYEYINTR